jgi:hypothetical protein
MGILHPRIRDLVDARRYAGALAAKQQRVAGGEREVCVDGVGSGREQNEAALPRLLKGCERPVPGDLHMIEIVEPGALEIAVAHVETGGSDDVDGDAEAGREPQDRASILRNVRLIERQAHGSDFPTVFRGPRRVR